MTDDDDPRGGPGPALDLDAWEPPPPPPGLAAAVVARARAAAPVAAIEVTEGAKRGRGAWWIGAGAVGVAAAAAAVLAWNAGSARTPGGGAGASSGTVVAARPEQIALGASAAALDPGAEVRWRRDGDRVAVAQPRGTAMWRIAESDTFVIDAGAMGASVEASGASLRVEVQMNRMDARVIGTSAATAAAVAAVVVMVYEGHVKVSRSGGPPVVVEAGTVYEVRAPEAPEPVVVGGRPKAALDRADISGAVSRIRPAITACGDGRFHGMVKARIEVAPSGEVASVAVTPEDAAVAACVATAVRDAKFPATVGGGSFSYPFVFTVGGHAGERTCDVEALSASAKEWFLVGEYQRSLEGFEEAIACEPSEELVQRAFLAACRAKRADKAKQLYRRVPPHMIQSCLASGIDPRD